MLAVDSLLFLVTEGPSLPAGGAEQPGPTPPSNAWGRSN